MAESHNQQPAPLPGSSEASLRRSKQDRYRGVFWLLAVVILAVAVGLVVRMAKTAPAAPTIEPKVRSWSVATLSATPTTVAPTLPVVGNIVSPLSAMLTAQTSAAVIEVHRLAGDSVQAGDRLINLDSDTQRLNLASREAQLQSAEAQLSAEVSRARADKAALAQEQRLQQLAQSAYNRQQKLQSRDLGAQSRVDDAAQVLAQRKLAVIQRQLLIAQANARRDQLQAAVEQARSAVALAQLELQRTEITAPYAARVQTVSVSVGQQIAPGQPLVSLYSPAKLELQVQLTPRRLQQLQNEITAGRFTTITATGMVDGQPISATLNRLGADIATGSGAVDAFFSITSGSHALQPGRTVEMDVQMPPLDNVVVMPPAAVYGNNRAYLLADPDEPAEASGDTESAARDDSLNREVQVMRSIHVEIVGEQRQPDGQLWLIARSPAFTVGAELIITQIPGAADGVAVQPVAEQAG